MDRDSVLVIIGTALVITLIGLLAISVLEYRPLQLPQGGVKTTSFMWGDVYVPERISTVRYEVIEIYQGDMKKTVGLYSVNKNPDGSYLIDITTYDGTMASNVTAQMKIDSLSYSCVAKYYSTKTLTCSEPFGDENTELAARILPNNLKKTDVLETIGVESVTYKSEVYQAVKLSKGGIYVWVAQELPLPVRIEIHDNSLDSEKITIANLKSFE